jgi:hypothetical protein
MEYVAYLKQLELPHWLIIGGGAIVLFGMAGIVRRDRQ